MTLGLFGVFSSSVFGSVVATAAGAPPVGRAYVTVGGERLDQVAQAAYGFQVGAVEALLVANPGIADLGFELPPCLAVLLPELEQPATSNEVALFTGLSRVRTTSTQTAPGRASVYTTVGGERLDQIAQDVYGFQVGAVEALLIVNPGLADLGFELPAGAVINLPELGARPARATSTTPVVSREAALWG